MHTEKSCGAVVFTRTNDQIKYVLIQQLAGFWGFPKGHMEEGETEVETALREIYEEVGLRPTIIEDFKTHDQYLLSNKNVMKQLTYFLAEYENQEIVIQESELADSLLVPYEEALKKLTYESARNILRQANNFLLHH